MKYKQKYLEMKGGGGNKCTYQNLKNDIIKNLYNTDINIFNNYIINKFELILLILNEHDLPEILNIIYNKKFLYLYTNTKYKILEVISNIKNISHIIAYTCQKCLYSLSQEEIIQLSTQFK
jgi:hypothetical protein